MGRIDEIKEEIGWLKVWLGIAVAAGFGMIGWFVSNYQHAQPIWLMLDMVGIIVTMLIVYWTNQRAIKRIRELRDIKKDD
jgi:uncharacterized membrane protein